MSESTSQVRLCPNCANSIDEDAPRCPYCKTDLGAQFVPRWLKRDESRVAPTDNKKFSVPPKFIWLAALLFVALSAFLAGGYIQRRQLSPSTQAGLKQLQAKDQVIQSQEAQLAQMRQQLNESSAQLAEMKTKLEESRNQRTVLDSRKVERQNPSRSVASRTSTTRAADAAPPPSVASKRSMEPGVYETTRPTSVHENPSSSSRVLSQINRGTKINVVGSSGDWLEVRSKHGKPPGYVQSADARLLGRSN